MKALVLTEYNKLEIREVPMPVPQPDEVLVKVMAAGICGSDVHGMDAEGSPRCGASCGCRCCWWAR